MTPPSEVHLSDPAAEAATGRAHQVSAPATRRPPPRRRPPAESGGLRGGRGRAPAKKAPAKKAPRRRPRRRRRRGRRTKAPTATDVDGDAEDDRSSSRTRSTLVVEDIVLDVARTRDREATPDVAVEVEGDEVVVTVGKKRTLDDVDESTFEPAGRPSWRASSSRGPGLHPVRGRRRRRARAAGDGGRRDRRPGQGLPEADRQGRPAERRAGGRARQADRGRPVRRREAQRRRAQGQGQGARRLRLDRRGRPAGQEPPARGQPAAGGLAWPSATPAAACCSWT